MIELNKTWNEENDYVIENIFDRLMKNSSKEIEDPTSYNGVEFYITANCNQKCEYCYLVKNKNKIYPQEFANNEVILKNLKIILQYFIEKEYYPRQIDLFSGEIWDSKLGIQVLEILLDYCKRTKHPPTIICIPSNFSFLLKPEVTKVIEEFIEGFDYYQVRLLFSASIDGPILEEDNRSFVDIKKNRLKNNDFYDLLFNWCKEHSFGFHPMVNAFSIEKWPEQYKWWVQKIKEYGFNTFFDYTMFLEVRNDEWTDEKIKSYLNFLNHVCEINLKELFNNNVNDLLSAGLNLNVKYNNDKYHLYNYYNIRLSHSHYRQGCSVDRLLCIRLGDLAWAPCHRTSYEKFIYGKFKLKNEKIVGIQALNLPLLFTIFGLGYGGHPKCDVCSIRDICMRGCYGAQFETHKEIFYPCPTVCNLAKAKTLFLYEKYKKLAEETNNLDALTRLEDLSAQINGIEKEFIDLWNPYIQTLI